MQVRVLFFGILKEAAGRSEEWLEFPSHATLGDVYERYAERFATLGARRSSILFAKNREFSKADAVLSENDEVAFLPPVSGGSDAAGGRPDGHIFGIVREAIDSRKLAGDLQRPEDGAVVVFEGVVRNNSRGRATAYLEYECYEEMALAQMRTIGQEIAAEFLLGRIGILHRLGRLEIGEASVAVVATAPHRRAAFAAALAGIDRLKREVPIWKKEVFTDGEEWVEGEWDEKLVAITKNEAL